MRKLGLLLIVAAGASCTSKEPPPAHDYAASKVADASGGPAAGYSGGPAAGYSGGSAAGYSGGPAAGYAGGSAAGYSGGSAAGYAGGSAEGIASLNMTGPLPHHAANCPSLLPGTTTRLVMTRRGVDVSVTSKDPRIARRIVELARYAARDVTAKVSRPHNQEHGGPGWLGYCPIVVTDQTTVTMRPIGRGATLHVNARSPSLVPLVQEVVKTRAARLPGHVSS